MSKINISLKTITWTINVCTLLLIVSLVYSKLSEHNMLFYPPKTTNSNKHTTVKYTDLFVGLPLSPVMVHVLN